MLSLVSRATGSLRLICSLHSSARTTAPVQVQRPVQRIPMTNKFKAYRNSHRPIESKSRNQSSDCFQQICSPCPSCQIQMCWMPRLAVITDSKAEYWHFGALDWIVSSSVRWYCAYVADGCSECLARLKLCAEFGQADLNFVLSRHASERGLILEWFGTIRDQLFQKEKVLIMYLIGWMM